MENRGRDQSRRKSGLSIAAEQPSLTSAPASYGDHVVFPVFQYARLGCPDKFVSEGSALRRCRDGLVGAFGGLGDRYPGYPTARQSCTASGKPRHCVQQNEPALRDSRFS